MLKVKEELRVINADTDHPYCLLTDDEHGMLLSEYVEVYGVDTELDGFEDISDAFKSIKKKSSNAALVVGGVCAAAGGGLCYNRRKTPGVIALAVGTIAGLCALVKRNTTSFRDAQGNEVDLLLGTVKVAGDDDECIRFQPIVEEA